MEALQHSRRALAGLAKLPDAPRTTTYRGLALTQTELDGYKKGNKAPPWAAFSSHTTKRDTAAGYAQTRAWQQSKLAVLMISTVTHGKDINPISLYPREAEILVLPGAEFTVRENDGIKQGDGVYEVHLTQTGQKNWKQPAVTEPRVINQPPLAEIPSVHLGDYEKEKQFLLEELAAEVLAAPPSYANLKPRLRPQLQPLQQSGEPPAKSPRPPETEPRLRPRQQPGEPPAKSARPRGQIALEEGKPTAPELPREYAIRPYDGWSIEELRKKESALLDTLINWSNQGYYNDKFDIVSADLTEVQLALARSS
jgi:hypothetical protein